jgi:hypothetical protein
MNHGQSEATDQKEFNFATCIGLSAWNAARHSEEYWGTDLNCGPGENRDNGSNTVGSPILLKRAMNKRKLSGRIYCCDTNKDALNALKKHFFDPTSTRPSGIQVFFKLEHNRDFLSKIPEEIERAGQNPRTINGIIIADPNGLHVPLYEIGNVCQECPKFDVLIHLYGARQFFPLIRNRPGTKFNPNPGTVSSLTEIFNVISTRDWIVTNAFRRGIGRDHMVLFGFHGRNKEIRGQPGRENMYSIDSKEGKRIIAEHDGLEFIVKTRSNQPFIEGSSWICDKCGETVYIRPDHHAYVCYDYQARRRI